MTSIVLSDSSHTGSKLDAKLRSACLQLEQEERGFQVQGAGNSKVGGRHSYPNVSARAVDKFRCYLFWYTTVVTFCCCCFDVSINILLVPIFCKIEVESYFSVFEHIAVALLAGRCVGHTLTV